ncbi:MAG: hypothetical protein RR058_07495 [Oscillospiraceae bacterium]
MKRFTCSLLIAALLLSLISCGKSEQAEQPQPPPPAQTGGKEEKPDDKENDKPQNVGDYFEPQKPTFCVPDNVVDTFVKLVEPFNTFPVEFTDAAKLSDEALFFAAAGSMGSAFLPGADGSYSIGLSDLESVIHTLFGSNAKFSDGYKTKDYSPYTVDAEKGMVYKYGAGSVQNFLFKLAVIETKDKKGYELWLVDLMDPAFVDIAQYKQMLMDGSLGSVTWEQVKGYCAGMQTNIYTIKKNDDGSYYLAGFRYKNFKNIEHYTF